MEYDPFSDVMKDDPFPVYARLRAESPVHWLERHECWAFSRFEDIWNAGQQPDLYPSPGPTLSTIVAGPEADEGQGSQTIFGLNPPLHTQLRKGLARVYSPRGVSRWEDHVRATTRAALDEVDGSGKLDVVQDLGLRVSAEVACLLIGLPVEDAPQLAAIVRRVFTRVPGVDGAPPDAIQASLELHEYLTTAVATRRREGKRGDAPDALDYYLEFEPYGAPLDAAEVASHLGILVVGGTETLPKVFAGGIIQLHRHPDQREALVEDPSLLKDAITEIARYEMPTQFLTRRVGRDHELRGQLLREGQGVMFLYRAANRDEAEFPDPDRFDIHRKPPRILAFGQGTHVCLGQHAARLEARVMFEELLERSPRYELDEGEIVPERSEFVAGYVAVPVQLSS